MRHIRKMSVMLMIAVMGAGVAQASITGLLDAGKSKQALQAVDQALEKSPKDYVLRFQRSRALAQLQRTTQAVAVLEQLIEERPDQAEFYNNLAILYTQKGDYQSAADILNRGLQTSPVYAALHENLGDVYAHMASRAYHVALASEGEKSTIPAPTMVALNHLDRPLEVVTETEPLKVAVVPVQSVESRVETTVEPALSTKQTVVATTRPAPISSVAFPAETAVRDEVAESPLVAAEKKVKQLIAHWAGAWSDQNISEYIASYSGRFVPPQRLSRQAWERQRQQRLSKPTFIHVSFTQVRFEVLSKSYARVRFLQRYASDRYSDSGEKVLELTQEDGGWKILSERSG